MSELLRMAKCQCEYFYNRHEVQNERRAEEVKCAVVAVMVVISRRFV